MSTCSKPSSWPARTNLSASNVLAMSSTTTGPSVPWYTVQKTQHPQCSDRLDTGPVAWTPLRSKYHWNPDYSDVWTLPIIVKKILHFLLPMILTHILQRYPWRRKMNFLHQGFRKLSYYIPTLRHTYTHIQAGVTENYQTTAWVVTNIWQKKFIRHSLFCTLAWNSCFSCHILYAVHAAVEYAE